MKLTDLRLALVLAPFLCVGCEDVVDNYLQSGTNTQSTVTSTTGATTATTDASGTSTTASADANELAHGLVMSQVQLQGQFDFRNAQITAKMTGASYENGLMNLTWEAHSWPYYDGWSDGLVCCVWPANGGWTGAYFDWAPANTTGYAWGLGHIINNYSYIPASGTEVGFFLMSVDGSQRTDVVFTPWP